MNVFELVVCVNNIISSISSFSINWFKASSKRIDDLYVGLYAVNASTSEICILHHIFGWDFSNPDEVAAYIEDNEVYGGVLNVLTMEKITRKRLK